MYTEYQVLNNRNFRVKHRVITDIANAPFLKLYSVELWSHTDITSSDMCTSVLRNLAAFFYKKLTKH